MRPEGEGSQMMHQLLSDPYPAVRAPTDQTV